MTPVFDPETLTGPTLLLDPERCRTQIRRMAEKAVRNRAVFRPHFKTHQSAAVGKWFRESGVSRITVSSLAMARYFADHGWQDITLAFPVNPRETGDLRRLGERITLHLTVTSPDAVLQLDKARIRCGIYIEIDAGYHRSGVSTLHTEEIRQILLALQKSDRLSFKGFLSHFGNTYNARSREEIRQIYTESLSRIRSLQHFLSPEFGEIPVSVGDTPSCSIMEDLQGVSEIRPGNFVLYDAMQYHIGACRVEDIAVCLAAPVVFTDPDRLQIVVHGGAVHLSKEKIFRDDHDIYGLVVQVSRDGWSLSLDGCYVASLSQEHGVLQLTREAFPLFRPGDLAGILPVHSCLAVSCMRRFKTLDGSDISCMDPLTA